MSKTRWSEIYTVEGPPGPKRTKVDEERKHSVEEWNWWKPRIAELYKKHKISEVKRILENEGFSASEKQLKDHLDREQSGKYFKLPESQWEVIARTAVIRSIWQPEKKTAFRFKLTGEPLPTPNVQRGLERKIKHGAFSTVFSMAGTLSSRGISAYTSASRGFRLGKSVLTKVLEMGPTPRVNEWPALAVVTENAHRSNFAQAALRFSAKDMMQRYPDDRVELTTYRNSFIDIVCEDCTGYSYYGLIKHQSFTRDYEAFKIVPERGSGRFRAAPESMDTHSFRHTIAKLKGITSAYRAWNAGSGSDIGSAFKYFEENHLEDLFHRKRVKIRAVGGSKQWEGRDDLVATVGLTCGHGEPPFYTTQETEVCWALGGCRWSQLKVADEIEALSKRQLDSKDEEPPVPSRNGSEAFDVGDFLHGSIMEAGAESRQGESDAGQSDIARLLDGAGIEIEGNNAPLTGSLDLTATGALGLDDILCKWFQKGELDALATQTKAGLISEIWR